MKGSLAVPFAVAGTLLLITLDVIGHMGRDSGAWLLEPATSALYKTCAVIVVLWYAGFALIVMVSRYCQAAEDENRYINQRAPVIPLPDRRRPHNPPTQPIPVPPSGEVSAINE